MSIVFLGVVHLAKDAVIGGRGIAFTTTLFEVETLVLQDSVFSAAAAKVGTARHLVDSPLLLWCRSWLTEANEVVSEGTKGDDISLWPRSLENKQIPRGPHMAGLLLLLFGSLFAVGAVRPSDSLIPRELLFGESKYAHAMLSPDGNTIAYLAPDEHGVRNIFTRCVTCSHTEKVSFDSRNNITSFEFTGVPNVILFTQDNDGDENHRLYKLNLTRSSPPHRAVAISDRPRVKAVVVKNNLRDRRVLVALNDESPIYHNVYSFDLYTDELSLVFHNKRFPARFAFDNDLNLRLVSSVEEDGAVVYFKPSAKADPRKLTSAKENWDLYLRVSAEDAPLTDPIAFTADNRQVYWKWGVDSDLGQLVVHEFGRPETNHVLYSAKKAEIASLFLHPTEKTVLALTEYYHKPEIFVANQTIYEDMQYLVDLRPYDSPMVVGVSRDFHTWLVTYLSDDKPFEFYLYRRWQKKAEYLFSTRPELNNRRLGKMVGFDFEARDGLRLQAYLSLPPTAALRLPGQVNASEVELAKQGLLPETPQKMVLLVHGGPHMRDVFEFSSLNTLLTDRGYAVLQVNFRGSTGFGKKLRNAGNGEWGRKMQFDLLDGVRWAVRHGVADPGSVAIMGGSYGGYATLVAMSLFAEDEAFACGVDIVGPSNLITLLETMPPYWMGMYHEMVKSLGADKVDEAGRQSLRSRSPLFHASQVKKPLLVLHGANDPRVKQAESDQFVLELQKNRIPVTYVLFGDEGHGFAKPQNTLAFAGFVETFLGACLQGAAEPYVLGQYNSSAKVIADASTPEHPLTTVSLPSPAPSRVMGYRRTNPVDAF
uniref:Peptidase_S9 domain-containing protein n=1 Tax=Steinernema glaseri TaxID=37863 RepID=A0A1I8A1S4_9BILA